MSKLGVVEIGDPAAILFDERGDLLETELNVSLYDCVVVVKTRHSLRTDVGPMLRVDRHPVAPRVIW